MFEGCHDGGKLNDKRLHLSERLRHSCRFVDDGGSRLDLRCNLLGIRLFHLSLLNGPVDGFLGILSLVFVLDLTRFDGLSQLLTQR